MTVEEFKKTMLQIDGIVWVDEETGKEVVCPNSTATIVDAYFTAQTGFVKCAVYIKGN